MFEGYANFIARFRYFIIAAWVVGVVLTVALSPNLTTVVSHESANLPQSSPVVQAQNLLNRINPRNAAQSVAVVAIHDSSSLTATEKSYLQAKLGEIEIHKANYGASSVQDEFNTDKSAQSAFISKDHTTEIGLVGFTSNANDQVTADALNRIHKLFVNAPKGASIYFTGDAPIEQDDANISRQGTDKTAGVTIALVLAILLVVFRSVVAPFVTLLSIGLSFMMSSSLVAWLAGFGLPVSTFTQTFLIAILFGAGTDYSIIIMNRFREEMTKGHPDKTAALAATMKAVGKTVFFSGLTVLISFAMLSFAKFGLYQSAVGVAIGMFVVLLACLTFIPALIHVLGDKLFWPRKPVIGGVHKPSRIWGVTSSISLRHPWWTILVMVIALLPIALLFTNDRTFDPMTDIPNAPTVKGFHVVATAFGSGYAMPTDIIVNTNQNLRTPEGLAAIETISQAVASRSEVKEVDSATRPLGKIIPALELTSENQLAASGLGKIHNGLSTFSQKLNAAGKQITLGQQGAHQLLRGSQQVSNGILQLQQGFNQATRNTNQLANGAVQLSSSEQQLSEVASKLTNAIAQWAKEHPDVAVNPQWQQIVQLAEDNAFQSTKTTFASTELSGGLQQLSNSMPGLVSGAGKLVHESNAVTGGIQSMADSFGQLSSGLIQASTGVSQLDNGLSQVSSYLTQSQNAVIHGDPGFYVPKAAISSNEDLKNMMNAYISPDGHLAQIKVILNLNPYSSEAIADVPTLAQTAQTALSASPIHTGKIELAGASAIQSELNRISDQDFSRTMFIVLLAIFVLLTLLLRSVIASMYIILSLVGGYFVTMGLVQELTIHILHQPGISWPVPFFIFLLLVALGVDYAIFLMSRFDEEHHEGGLYKEAMKKAMNHMGGVIFSAAFIMAGTFGSMAIAGVTSLVEIGSAIMIGLFIYTTVILGFFVPACTSIVGQGHQWPFDSGKGK